MITSGRVAGKRLIHCYHLNYLVHWGAGRSVSILAPDVLVRLRGRRLGDIDRVRAGKGLLQPLVRGCVEPALLGIVDPFGTRTWPGHGRLLRLLPRSDLADGSSVLDDRSEEHTSELQS